MRVLVTGAASGIGRATCLTLAREASRRGETGRVAAVDLQPSAALERLIGELRELGADPLPLYGDMGTRDQPARVVEEAVDRFGALDGLVSNAGINRPGPLASYPVEDWDRLFDVNVRATFLLAQAAHPTLRATGGAIAIVGSMSGSNAHAGLGAYAPTKAAVIMLMRVLAQEFGRDGIRVNSVSPGMVRTGMTEAIYADPEIASARDELVPLGRVARPDDIADAIAFLLGPQARYVNGHDLIVDGLTQVTRA
jgi:NAD(P)-dependent dehydrogenase (short-subunit alcohol dehydrogenase family)